MKDRFRAGLEMLRIAQKADFVRHWTKKEFMQYRKYALDDALFYQFGSNRYWYMTGTCIDIEQLLRRL